MNTNEEICCLQNALRWTMKSLLLLMRKKYRPIEEVKKFIEIVKNMVDKVQ